MRVILREGMQGATVREIAKEAGYSNGVLAHYFENKQQILVMAHEAAFGEARRRIAEVTTNQRSVDGFRAALHEALPLGDEQRHLEAFVDVSFWAEAIRDPQLREVRNRSHLDSIARWEARIALMRAEGYVTWEKSDRHIAEDVMLLVDGFSIQALLHPEVVTKERMLEEVEEFIERMQRG